MYLISAYFDVQSNKVLNRYIKQIAEKMLQNLKEKVKNIQIDIDFTEKVVEKLAENGFDDIYGARPLRREIQRSIEDNLSEKILDGSIKNGSKILCDYQDGEFIFS